MTEPTGERRFQIKEQMDNLKENVTHMESNIEKLKTRLAPILNPQTSDENKDDGPKEIKAPHADEIEAINNRLYDARSKLGEIIDDIEI